jgi:large subunit ribosomal protein L1
VTSKVEDAKAAGADFAGGKEMLEKIQKENWFDFDVIVATPDMMGELGKMGRVLGPKGLMPNPKTGTVAVDISKAVQEIKRGKVEYRVDKDGNIHVSIARVSFDSAKIIDNLTALCDLIVKVRPSSVKGTYIKNAVIHTTMGPSIKITFAGR